MAASAAIRSCGPGASLAEMRELSGDAGARALFAPHAELICEVEAGSDAPLTDIDTEDALCAFQARGKP